ncbi:hypothetical protein FAM19024_000062 [Propionibacterium freudenreichii]|uniref:ATP-binding protein n=1 Tax=Propionibacterium freudenreichii TaxID=1744 RepID=UPI0027A82F5A|nr:hypothetical protein FAM19024_000062 [Propionibacterium freudenreichii]
MTTSANGGSRETLRDQPSRTQEPSNVNGDTVGVVDFVESNERIGNVPVKLSYGIIERFSEGLYSSPNKTFEELITNSYDAGAREVWVYLATDLSSEKATLLVVDDGESMTLDGLADLWKIGESRKRSETPPPGRKKPGWCHSVEATLPVGGGLIGGVCGWRGWGCRSVTGRRSRRPRKRAGRCGGSPVTWGVARR